MSLETISQLTQQFRTAVVAACPGAEVRIVNGGAGPISFPPGATAGQISAANAVAASFDFSDAARIARHVLTLRQQAQTALDTQRGETIAIDRAIVRELLDYENNMRQAFNTLLTWLGTQTTLINRNQLAAMQRPLATPAQAFTAIKNRLNSGEAD